MPFGLLELSTALNEIDGSAFGALGSCSESRSQCNDIFWLTSWSTCEKSSASAGLLRGTVFLAELCSSISLYAVSIGSLAMTPTAPSE